MAGGPCVCVAERERAGQRQNRKTKEQLQEQARSAPTQKSSRKAEGDRRA